MTMDERNTWPTDDVLQNVVNYYNHYDEQNRLMATLGQVEYARTQHILNKYLKQPSAIILDIGGAAGRYACWLAQEGHEVHLVDPVPLHIQQAQEASAAQSQTPLASCKIGDARQLAFDDNLADAVLLMGPLYHLVQAQDRYRALEEAYRVLKVDGYVFAVGISRFASTIDGLTGGEHADPAFQAIMRHDLEDGQHRNPTQHPAYFTDTFFHHPDELKAEVRRAGFEVEALLAVEGISYMMKDLEQKWPIEKHRKFLLEIIEKTEQEPSLMGASLHVMCVGRKPGLSSM